MSIYNITKLLSLDFGLAIKQTNIPNPPLTLVIIFVACIIVLAVFILLIHRKNAHKYTGNPNRDIKLTSNELSGNVRRPKFNIVSKSNMIEELNNDLEPFGFAYYPKQDLFYSIMYGWQRDCGYCELYDEGAPTLSMIIDCEPIRFEYEGKKWLIEFWKGQYGMTTGCEIGIYTTDGPSLNIPGFFDGTFYYSASIDNFLPLAYELRKNGSLLFTRSELHWWLTGFKLGEFSDPSELEMSVEITLKDMDMCNEFINGMLDAGYSSNDITVLDTTVRFIFDKPHSPQPITRTQLLEYFMQTNNQRNCDAYELATRHCKNTLDKIEFVKHQAPRMYRKILNIGNTKELFSSYKTIQKFIDHDNITNE